MVLTCGLPPPCKAVTLHYSRPLSRGSKRFRFRFRFRLLLHHAACYCQGTDDSGNEGADGVNDNAPVFFVKCHNCNGLKGLKSLKGLKGLKGLKSLKGLKGLCGSFSLSLSFSSSCPQLYYTGITNPREHMLSLLRRLQIPVNTRTSIFLF